MGSLNEINIGKVIQELMEQEPGLTVKKLADQIGANRNTLDNIILDNAIPRGIKTIVKLANRFDVSLDEIVFGLNNQTQKSKMKQYSSQVDKEIIEILVSQPITLLVKQNKKISDT